MPAQITDKVKLKDVIFLYSEAAKQTEAEFLRLWRIAFRGFTQMGLNAFWEPITQVLPVLPNKIALFPDDQIVWCKIGYLNQAGELATLRVNDNLTTYKDASANRIADITDEVAQVAPYLNGNGFWYDCNGFSGIQGYGWRAGYCMHFGAGSHMQQPGNVKVDYNNRCYVLDTNTTLTNIAVMYLSSPIQNDDYQIPIQFQEALISWLGWQDDVYLPATSHMNNNSNAYKGNIFRAQVKLAKKMYKPFRLQEAYQEVIEAQNLGLKIG